MTDFDCDTNTAKKRFFDLWDSVDFADQKFDNLQLEKIFYFLWNNLEPMLEAQGIDEEVIIEINNSFFGDGLSTVEMVNDNFHIFENYEKSHGHTIHTQKYFSITTTILEGL
jgi:hypothetical protein